MIAQARGRHGVTGSGYQPEDVEELGNLGLCPALEGHCVGLWRTVLKDAKMYKR